MSGAAFWLLSASVASAYLVSTSALPPPDYSSSPPPVGESYEDPVFGTTVKRISNALDTPDAADTGNLEFIMNEYSTMSAFSQDNARLILHHGSYYGLYDGSGRYIRDLPLEINASSEPRWARDEPRTLYYLRGNELRRHSVASEETSTEQTFDEYTTVTGKGESDISFDGDHFVLMGDDREIFVYQISTEQKSTVLDTGGLDVVVDAIYITPDNNVTVTWVESGTDRFQGIELFDPNMDFVRQVAPAGGHMDVTRDTNGNEVLVWANANDPDPDPECENALVKIRLSDASETCLVSLDWSLAAHVSAPDGNGWVHVSTYAPSDPDPTGSWPVYTNELLQVRLDGSEVRRLAHHRSRPFEENDFNYTPRASVSRDGSRLVFSSNFGLQEDGYPTQYSDAYLVEFSSLRFWNAHEPGSLPLSGLGKERE